MDQKEKKIRLRFKPVVDRHKKTKNAAALKMYEALIREEIKRLPLKKSKKDTGGI